MLFFLMELNNISIRAREGGSNRNSQRERVGQVTGDD